MDTRSYLHEKLLALRSAENAAQAYLAAIESTLAKVKEVAAEAKRVADRDKERRVQIVTQRGIQGLPFYRFDSSEGQSSLGLEVMKEIGGDRRKRNRAGRVSQAELVSLVNTSSSDESSDEYTSKLKKEEDLPPPEEEDFEDFDSRSEDGRLGKRLQQNTKPQSADYPISKQFNGRSSNSECSMDWSEKKAEWSGATKAGAFDQDQSHAEKLQNHTQRLNTIIMENEMTPQNIQNFNLVEIAAKKNSAKHLQESGPLFGLQIYRQLRVWNGMKPSELLSNQSVTWTPEEDSRLIQLVELFSERRWKQISIYMDAKKPSQCYHRWFRVLSPKRMTTKWDDPMDDVLLGLGTLMFKRPSGKVRWVRVAELFEGRRTDVQCRERFANILDPNLKTNLATENHELAKGLYNKFGRQWAKIAKEVKGSTDNLIKRIVERKAPVSSESISEQDSDTIKK